jgi:hypothetical protein
MARGAVKKFDAASGTLTGAVCSRGNTQPMDRDFRVTDASQVTVYGARPPDTKELSRPDGLRRIKEGARVRVLSATANPRRSRSTRRGCTGSAIVSSRQTRNGH